MPTPFILPPSEIQTTREPSMSEQTESVVDKVLQKYKGSELIQTESES